MYPLFAKEEKDTVLDCPFLQKMARVFFGFDCIHTFIGCNLKLHQNRVRACKCTLPDALFSSKFMQLTLNLHQLIRAGTVAISVQYVFAIKSGFSLEISSTCRFIQKTGSKFYQKTNINNNY